MINHTGGKWKAFFGTDWHFIRQAQPDKNGRDSGQGLPLAMVVKHQEIHGWANAVLCSHAPEMYEMLLDILHSGEHHGEIRLEPIRQLLENMEASAEKHAATRPPAIRQPKVSLDKGGSETK